jgi:hypothetical protein
MNDKPLNPKNNMNLDQIDDIAQQIEDSPIVVVDDSPMLHSVTVYGNAEGIEDEEILMLNWFDDEGQEFVVKFTEGNLDKANFKDNQILLCDSEGNNCVISLYNLEKKPVVKSWE